LNGIIYFLFLLGVALITFEGLPFARFSNYSPISIFPLFAGFMLALIKGIKLKKVDILFFLFCFYSISHSLIMAMIYNDISSSIKHIITIIIGFSIYIFSFYVTEKYLPFDKNINRFTTSLYIAFTIPVIIGLLQLMSQLNITNDSINNITTLFVKVVYNNRIQMLSSEPSWAIIHILTALILFIFINMYNGKKTSIMVICLGILFILSFSAFGYGVVVFALLLFMILQNKNRLKTFFAALIVLFVVFTILPFMIETFNIQGYYTHRFQLDELSISNLLERDESFFVRIIFPVIGVIQFINFPIFGVGGGFYYVEFANMMIKYFPYALDMAEVNTNVFVNPEAANPRNLFSKILSEEGILGGILFFSFLIVLYNKYAKNNYSKLVFCLAISFTLNFDSYALVDFWLLIGLLRGGFFEREVKL
jgi:hypothetical protein